MVVIRKEDGVLARIAGSAPATKVFGPNNLEDTDFKPALIWPFSKTWF